MQKTIVSLPQKLKKGETGIFSILVPEAIHLETIAIPRSYAPFSIARISLEKHIFLDNRILVSERSTDTFSWKIPGNYRAMPGTTITVWLKNDGRKDIRAVVAITGQLVD